MEASGTRQTATTGHDFNAKIKIHYNCFRFNVLKTIFRVNLCSLVIFLYLSQGKTIGGKWHRFFCGLDALTVTQATVLKHESLTEALGNSA